MIFIYNKNRIEIWSNNYDEIDVEFIVNFVIKSMIKFINKINLAINN